MDNKTIASFFTLLSKLMDIHGENSFRSKSYSIAAFAIEKAPAPIASMSPEQVASLKGIGENMAARIHEIISTGKLDALETIIQKTPPGILEMLQIKGLGPKKIAVIWKEMELESIGELLYACHENRLTLYKGFGEKTQEGIKQAINFYLSNQGHFLFREAEIFAQEFTQALHHAFPEERTELTGQIRREDITLDKIEWVTTVPGEKLQSFLAGMDIMPVSSEKDSLSYKTPHNVSLLFYPSTIENFVQVQFIHTASPSFMEQFPGLSSRNYSSEEIIFEEAGWPFIPAYLREEEKIALSIKKNGIPASLLQPGDIKGIIHSHSNWSDGKNTLEEMAEALIARGMEYLVISDHSRSAGYANGLSIERVLAQQQQVEELNKKYAPFRIFKSIESDILNDGSLDYPAEILATFDLVIASVHSNLKMPKEKAMARLLRAIENPYTRILGHLTGRLLLSRNGYPLDHNYIIDACAANNVVIELNAHPRRLDIDWHWIPYAMEKGVLLSVNPDAHSLEGFDDTRFGVLAARKGLLVKESNLSSFSLKELEEFIEKK